MSANEKGLEIGIHSATTSKDRDPIVGITLDVTNPESIHAPQHSIITPRDTVISAHAQLSPLKLKLLTNLARLIPPIAGFFMFLYIIVLLANSDNWTTEGDDSAEIAKRTKARGTFVSMLCAILITVAGVCCIVQNSRFMKYNLHFPIPVLSYIGISIFHRSQRGFGMLKTTGYFFVGSESVETHYNIQVITNLGFILAPVVGFVLLRNHYIFYIQTYIRLWCSQ